MGNSGIQNGVQTPQSGGTGMVQIVTARANHSSDDVEQQMDRLDKECYEVHA